MFLKITRTIRLFLTSAVMPHPQPQKGQVVSILARAVPDQLVRPPVGEVVVAAVREAGAYTLGGEHYKRVPSGYDADHPRADLLRYNGLWAHTAAPIDPAVIVTPELAEVCLEVLQMP